MAGHGSTPPERREGDPSRRVYEIGSATQNPGRVSAVMKPGPAGMGRGFSNRSDYRGGTYQVEGGLEGQGGLGNRTVMVSTPHRANVAVKNLAGRAAEGRDLYTGRSSGVQGARITTPSGASFEAGGISPAGVSMLRSRGSTVEQQSGLEASRSKAFSQGLRRETIEHEVFMGEHD